MIEHLLHPRITENKDWATILFVLSFALLQSLNLFMKIDLIFEFIFQINMLSVS
jgi:hypothetical protein